MVKKRAGQIAGMILAFFGAIVLIVTGLAQVFKWDWGDYVKPILLLAVGVTLMLQGNFKLKFKKRQTFENIVHRASAVIGTAVLLLGIITFPFLAGTTLPVITTFSGWITLLGGAWYVVEAFVP